jgi:hypothetical protein
MKRAFRWPSGGVALLGLLCSMASAQTVMVYSEFAQLAEDGRVIAPELPREILSPALARNAFTTFQLAIEVPRGMHFWVYIGQNPQDAVKVTLFRSTAGRLTRVELPYEGESAQVLWMDVWVDRSAPVRRVKVEPQVGINGDWVIYPMEARIVEAIVPEGPVIPNPGQGVAAPGRSVTFEPPKESMRAFLCGSPALARAANEPATLAELHARNAAQDIALARASAASVRQQLQAMLGGCGGKQEPDARDPEFYLRLRDMLFRAPGAAGSR